MLQYIRGLDHHWNYNDNANNNNNNNNNNSIIIILMHNTVGIASFLSSSYHQVM